MENIVNMPRPEILMVADTVAREKNIDREDVFKAMEEAIQKAGRSKYGYEHDIRVNINRKTGAITLARYRAVVDQIENETTELTLAEAQRINPEIKVGEYIIDPLPPIDFGRIAAQTAKQVIMQKVREAERNKQYEEYKGKIGTIINGTVKRVEFGNVIVDMGKTEAILRRDEIIPRESFKSGDRVRAYVLDVRRETRGPQIFLSRTCPEFMAKLFTSEVPEIYDGLVEIMSVARDPGSKAKIAVRAKDSSIDPVGACVGVKGSRIHSIVRELRNENIDVINYTSNTQLFITRALSPAKISSIKVDEREKRAEVSLKPEEVSLAIGKNGYNIRLASMLTGYEIEVFRDVQGDEEDIYLDEFSDEIEQWILDILKENGYDTAKSVLGVPREELLKETDLEEETIDNVLSVLRAEFE